MVLDYLGKKSVKVINNKDSVVDKFYNIKPPAKPVWYGNKLRIGWEPETKRPFYIDKSESENLLIVGRRRCGKSWLMHRILDVSHHSGIACVVLTDIKNEYISLKEPCDDRFKKFLARGETPTPLPVKSFKPIFLGSSDTSIPFQISLSKLSLTDFKSLFDMQFGSPPQQAAMNMLHQEIKDGFIIDLDDLEYALDDHKDIGDVTKKIINARLSLLRKQGVIGEEYAESFVDVIKNGEIPILNLEGFELLSRETSGLPQMYVAIILRELVEAKRNGTIKQKLNIFLDELGRFCHSRRETVAKVEIQEGVEVTAQYGISFIFGVQDINIIPEFVLLQSRFIFIPFNYPPPLAAQILKSRGLYSYSPSEYEVLRYEMKEMKMDPKTGNREWLAIDSNTKTSTKFYPYACMSKHKGET